MSFQLTVCIQHPRHCLKICIYIRSRNIRIRSYDRRYGKSITACKSAKFAFRESRWIYLNSSFCASIWKICHSTLQCHPSSKSFDLIKIAVLMKPNTALERTAYIRMLYSVALEYSDASIIHFNRKIDFCLPLRIFQYLKHRCINISKFHGLFHNINHVLIWIICVSHILPPMYLHCCISPAHLLQVQFPPLPAA